MTNPLVSIEKPAPGIALVTLQRQDKRNALNDALISALIDAAQTLRDDVSVKAIILTGGPDAFSAGADISTFEAIGQEPDVNRVRRMTDKGARMAELWQSMPAVTIAAVEGGAVGGGFGLALACDWRVFARNAFAYVPEVRLGLNYGWSTLPAWPRWRARAVRSGSPSSAGAMAPKSWRHGTSRSTWPSLAARWPKPWSSHRKWPRCLRWRRKSLSARSMPTAWRWQKPPAAATWTTCSSA